MKKIRISILLLFSLCRFGNAMEAFTWEELPELPPLPGTTEQAGLAGAFVGVHNEDLIIAGGTNFSDGLPWKKMADGSYPEKMYHRDSYVLPWGEEWLISDVKLHSYGVSISLDDGLLCIGGEWREYEKGNISAQSNGRCTIQIRRYDEI